MTEGVEESASPLDRRLTGSRTVTTSGAVLVGRVVAYLGSLLILIVTARQLGIAGRGALVLVVTLGSFSTIVATLGLPVAARLHLVDPAAPVGFDAFFGLSVATVLLQSAITPFLAWALLAAAHIHVTVGLVIAATLLAALNGLLYLIVAALVAFGRLAAASACDAASYVLQGAACATLMATGSRDTAIFIGGIAVALVPAIIAGLLLLSNTVPGRFRPRVDRHAWGVLTRTGLPSLTTVLCESATFRIDRLILGIVATPAAVGIYSVGAAAAEMLRFVPASVSQVVFYEVVLQRMTDRQLARIRAATIAVMGAVGAVAAVAAPTMIRAFLGESYLGAVTPFRVLLLAEMGFAFYMFDSTVLAANRQVGIAARAALVGLAAILVTDFGLIPPFEGAGAAWASVASYGAMAVVARRLLRSWRQRSRVEPDSLG